MKLNKYSNTTRDLVIALVLGFIVLLILYFVPLPKFKSYSKEIYSSEGELLAVYLSDDEKWRMQISLDEVSPDLIKAILYKEDKCFYYHFGINPFSLLRAIAINIIAGKNKFGASTITMQVARMMNYSDRTYLNKLKEMLLAIQLELHFSKKEILELYLNYLPMGGNIEGVKAAAYIYFNRPPSKLSLSQAITLILIPNNPNLLRLDKNSHLTKKLRDKWINKFMQNGVFPKQDLELSKSEDLPSERSKLEIKAPHFCQRVKLMSKDNIIKSTIELSKQEIVEELLKNHINKLSAKNISNGSVLVIDNLKHCVSVYCGSADFKDKASSGEVDGVIALRSPGSTLKSGLFALAFDMGFLTPKMKLLDVPTDFEGYIPENFSLEFKGDVAVEEALRQSLNIPAIRLLQKVGLNEFISHLSNASFADISKRKNELGLSMIVGGCAVSLEQLANYYTSFANSGNLFDLKYIEGTKSHSKKLFDSGTVYILSQILSNNERSDFPKELLHWTKLPKIAWKTGTSSGKRDAWAIGYNTHYTVGVWIGNFDGKGSPYLIGSEAAVPLLFAIFNSIDYGNKEWFEKPKSVSERFVCSETGLLPSENCNNLILDYYIEGISHNNYCELYRKVYTDSSEGVQYCPHCLPNEGYKIVYYPFYEPELLAWYLSSGIKIKFPPRHNTNCPHIASGAAPKIISPSESWEYFLDHNAKQEILLQAASESGIFLHYWYIDDKFYAASVPGGKLFFLPKKKLHKISCLDDRGRISSVTIKFSYY